MSALEYGGYRYNLMERDANGRFVAFSVVHVGNNFCMHLAPASAEIDFPRYQNGFSHLWETTCTMIKYGETFYDRHTAL